MADTWLYNPGKSCCEEEGEGCGLIRVTVRLCADNSLVSGAVVTILDADLVEVGTCTTGGTGICSVTILTAGTYHILVEKTGQASATREIVATCTTNDVAVKLGSVISFTLVSGCGCILPGATVSVTQTAGGSHSGSATTDASGNAYVWVPITAGAVFSWSISAPLYITSTGTIGPLTGTECGLSVPSHDLLSDPDYFCFGGNPPICRDPIPEELTVTFGNNTFFYGDLAGQTLAVPYAFTASNGYHWIFCGVLAVGGQTYQVEVWVTGWSQCSAPGGAVIYSRYASADCSGSPSAGPSTQALTAGTSACPVAFNADLAGTRTIAVSE